MTLRRFRAHLPRRPTHGGAMLATLVAATACLTPAPATAERVFEGEIEIGAGYLDESSFRYGKYSGLVDDGLELIVGFEFAQRPVWDSGATRYWRLGAERLGFDNRIISGEIGDQGSQRLRITYQETPRNLFDDGRTPFLAADASRLLLPAGWEVTDASTTDMTTLEQHLSDFSLRQERRETRLEYRLHFARHWRLEADMRRELRDGRRELAGTTGTTGGNARAALLPVPIDYQTDTFDISLLREGAGHLVGIAWHGSFFRNDEREISWQTPFAAHPQWQPGSGFSDGFGRLALVPDNDFLQLRAFGQFTLAPTTRASVDLAAGRMRQDQRFLPYSVDSALAPEPLPRADLDGKVDTLLAHLRVTSRPLPRLHLTARARHEERDDRSPRALFQPVAGDAGLQAAPEQGRINRPHSHTRREFGFDGVWRLPQRTRVNLGYEYRVRKRDFLEVTSAREHALRGGVRSNRFEFVSLSADYSHERRDASRYLGNRPLIATRPPGTVDAEDFENHPNLRKYYLADRDRDRLQLRADFHPDDRWHLGLAFAWSRDDYPDQAFGLNESRVRSWLVDGGWIPTDDVRFGAFYHHDRYRNEQSGRSFTAVPATVTDPDRDWFLDSQDAHISWGLNLDVTGIERQFDWLRTGGELEVGLEYVDSRSRGEVNVDTGPALAAADLPRLNTRFQLLRLELRYQPREATRFRLAFEHERYRSRDFALDGVAPDTVATILLFGDASPRYRANWFTLSVAHRF